MIELLYGLAFALIVYLIITDVDDDDDHDGGKLVPAYQRAE